jgi:hypothetical protein
LCVFKRRSGNFSHVLDKFVLAFVARKFLRTLRGCGGSFGRLQPAWRKGSIVGIVIGTALLQILQNLVNLLGIPSSLNFAVMGTVILIGVIADQMLKQQALKSV